MGEARPGPAQRGGNDATSHDVGHDSCGRARDRAPCARRGLSGPADHADLPWGAGGGTDATARIVASILERDLGVPVNVVNRTGGSGVVGHSAIATAAPDGYNLGIITVEIGMMHWQGLTELT